MKVVYLRTLRGDRSLRALAEQAGVAAGNLSRIENGRELPLDKHVPDLERVYGAPATDWYPPAVLLLIQADEQ